MKRLVPAVIAVACLASGCGSSQAGDRNAASSRSPSAAATRTPSAPATASARPSPIPGPGVDLCSLVTPHDMIGLGVPDDVMVAERGVGTREFACTYASRLFASDDDDWRKVWRGQLTLYLAIPEKDALRTLPTKENSGFDSQYLRGVGDRAVWYPYHKSVYVSVIFGDRLLSFSFLQGTGKVRIDRVVKLLRKVIQRLPANLGMKIRDLQGACANIDLAAMERAGFSTYSALSTEGSNGDALCTFADFKLHITSGRDAVRKFQKHKGSAGVIPIPGVNEESFFGGWVEDNPPSGSYMASIRVGDRVVALTGTYSGTVGPAEKVPPKLLHFLQTLPALFR